MPNDHSMKDKFLDELGPYQDGDEGADGSAAPSNRTVGQAPTLQLRLKSGRECAVPYPYITFLDYDPGVGIILESPTLNVVVKGHGLRQLFRQIAEHKRLYVEEFTSPARRMALNENRSRVEGIVITKPKKAKEEEDDTGNVEIING
jgi:hypothetical protein